MEPIILASKSPQRQDILRRLNIPFICIPAETDEFFDTDLSPEQAVENIALRKAEAVLRSPLKINTPWIIAADTLIFSQGQPMGKPTDAEHARAMLRSYSGTSHRVITAICCYDEKLRHISTRTNSSEVFFKTLSDPEIEWFLSTGEWQGAAGGYRIQGTAACFITKINGSYSGIVGLPIYELYDILTEHGYVFS
ncbi:MAG: Maf family protein [Treponema sp.]|uniref:Maf family protein n=1 Tax=Treponema sp. TaxID=166 RepID=UPI003FA21648